VSRMLVENKIVDTRQYLLDRLSELALRKPTGTTGKEIPYYSSSTYKRLEQHLNRIMANSSKTDLKKVRAEMAKRKGDVSKQSVKTLDDYLLKLTKKPKAPKKDKRKSK